MMNLSQIFLILLLILAFLDNIKAADDVEITELEKMNADKNDQNQGIIDEIVKEKGLTWNKTKNMVLNSTEKIANFVKETWKSLHGAQNKIKIKIRGKVGAEVTQNIEKIVEIMGKILEIDVKIVTKENWKGKNVGIAMQGTIGNRKIKSSLSLFEKQGKMEMNSVELGKELIHQICGGNECDQRDDLPEFGANPCSTKPPPELDELDRSLRPMLLKLSSKLNIDNPMPDFKNGFYVAFDFEVGSNLQHQINSVWLPLLKTELERFERNAPIRFIELQQNDKIRSSKFKNRIHFVIYKGRPKNLHKNVGHNWSWAENDGLKRNSKKNDVYLNAIELRNVKRGYYIQEILLKALGASAGEGLRIEFDRRDKYMPKLRRTFAQLNAAYGAENYYMVPDENQCIIDNMEVEFWMGPEYANFATRKYEIPVVYDDSFKEIANENKKLFDEVYANFSQNSVIHFVVHDEPPTNKNYVRIYRDYFDNKASAFVGHSTKRDSSYQGEKVRFGKNAINKRNLYHEFMHVAGMQHEHQRADVEQHIEVDRLRALKELSFDHKQYGINYMPRPTYLPVHEYNPRSIMHYDMNCGIFQPKSEKAGQHINQSQPSEPDQKDWENLNHFYGVGKGRTQFKVEIDQNGHTKIVDDIDGMRRLKK